jgi:hypothetical protein
VDGADCVPAQGIGTLDSLGSDLNVAHYVLAQWRVKPQRSWPSGPRRWERTDVRLRLRAEFNLANQPPASLILGPPAPTSHRNSRRDFCGGL